LPLLEVVDVARKREVPLLASAVHSGNPAERRVNALGRADEPANDAADCQPVADQQYALVVSGGSVAGGHTGPLFGFVVGFGKLRDDEGVVIVPNRIEIVGERLL
jgi:hypothetical protein